jgi:hypothetical protein
MVVVKARTDPDSLSIYRDGQHIGFVQWHKGFPPRIVLVDSYGYLTLAEVEAVLKRYEYERGGRQNGET